MKEKERERGKEMANALQGQHISALWASTIMSGTVAGTGIERQRGRETKMMTDRSLLINLIN